MRNAYRGGLRHIQREFARLLALLAAAEKQPVSQCRLEMFARLAYACSS
jgi:hypothetical protein